jgi:hypothetical protein
MTKVAAYFNGGFLNTVATEKEAFGGISALLTQIGLNKTADTGQIDIPSITVVITTGTYAGYEIRSWTDSVGTVFMKIEYGMNSNNTRLRITFGSGSDGAGNITGAPASQTNLIVQLSSVASYGQYYQLASRSGDSWSLAMFAAVGPIVLAFDRQRDPITGLSVAGTYYTFRTNASIGTTVCARTSDAFSVIDVAQKHALAVDYATGPGMSGLGLEPTTMEVMPVFGAWPHATVQPALMQYWAAEHMTPYGIFKANVYGQIRTYISISLGATSYQITYNATTKAGLAMLWED